VIEKLHSTLFTAEVVDAKRASTDPSDREPLRSKRPDASQESIGAHIGLLYGEIASFGTIVLDEAVLRVIQTKVFEGLRKAH
jgi:hypothetical protein